MESETFDAFVRSAANGGSRRTVLRAGVSTLALALGLVSVGGFEETEAKRRRARKQKKKKTKQGPPGPRGPAGPPGTPISCPVGQSATCGDGCCSSLRPTCCDDAFETSGKSCHAAADLCCPAAFGGGSCPPGTECCPLRKDGTFARSCLEPGDSRFCCPVNSGGACVTADEACCPPDKTNDVNRGCCLAGEACCNGPEDCAPGETCAGTGCCRP
jgi:hypothetical protein